jgi:glycerol kinase
MANIRKVLKQADAMAAEVKQSGQWPWLPDWAGLAWIISPYYCPRSGAILHAMGADWESRATRIVRALEIASDWRQEQRMFSA